MTAYISEENLIALFVIGLLLMLLLFLVKRLKNQRRRFNGYLEMLDRENERLQRENSKLKKKK